MWCGRFVIDGVKVSFWGSGTLKIVIPIENYPTNGVFGWLVITPYEGWRCELADSIYIFTIYIGGKTADVKYSTCTEIVPRSTIPAKQ